MPDEPKQSKLQSLGHFLYDKEAGKVMGRGCRSWSEIGLYYVIYYMSLSSFFAGSLSFYFSFQDMDVPYLQGMDNLLKQCPGLTFHPMHYLDSSIIYADHGSRRNLYQKDLDSFLKKYAKATDDGTHVLCNLSKVRPEGADACFVNTSKLLEQCNHDNFYGLATGKPCVLLTLNRIYGWTPRVWSRKDVKTVEKIPDNIKENYSDDRIWVHCYGRRAGDEENLGELRYFPEQGFPLGYYPYLKQPYYYSPLVFVQFINSTPGMPLMVQCDALALNIENDFEERKGSVRFELYIPPAK